MHAVCMYGTADSLRNNESLDGFDWHCQTCTCQYSVVVEADEQCLFMQERPPVGYDRPFV